jgi:hypothetical protein
MPNKRRPGRPRKNEIEERLSLHTRLDSQILLEHDTYLEIDISTPTLCDQIMKIDKVDYERIRSEEAGRFFAKPSSYHGMSPAAFVNTRKKDGEFLANATYVHNLVCRGKGYLWHRNADLLDNRRENLETELPIQSSTIGQNKTTASSKPKRKVHPKPVSKPEPETVYPEPQPYDPSELHPAVNILTGESEDSL